jgi:hypothetical protein
MPYSGICSDCKEHAEFLPDGEEEEEFVSERQKNFMESFHNGCRNCECMTQSNCKNEK